MQDLALQQKLPADRNPVAVYLSRLTSAGSRRTMRSALENIARLFDLAIDQMDWTALRYQHTQAIRAQLADLYAPATANRHLSALRGVLKEAWRLGYISAEEFQRASDVASVRETKLPKGRALDAAEIGALLKTCDEDGAIGVRDRALIAVLRVTGMRRAELSALDYADFNNKEGSLHIRRGKGRKQRIVYIAGVALEALNNWVAMRGSREGGLFISVDVNMERLQPNGIYQMLARRAARAGLPPFTPHDFRRTFVGDLLERGVDMNTVSRIAGHASIQTTARYDRRGEDPKKQAATLIDIDESIPTDDTTS